MKSLFLFMFLGFVISSYSANYIIIPASEREFGEAQSSSYNLLVDTNVVLKLFCLNCFEKIEKRFIGNLNDDYDIEYIGKIEVIDMCLFKIIDYNDEELFLLNCKNGFIQKILTNISCSFKYLASYDIPSGDNYRGIQIYKNQGKKIELIVTVENEDWFPISMYWLNSNSLIIKAQSFGNVDSLSYKKIVFE